MTARSRRAEIAWETGLFSCPAAVTGPAPVSSAEPDGGPATLARTSVERVSARAAYQWVLHGRAVIIDIRPPAQRAAQGEVHPDLRPVVIERALLERRLDPMSAARFDWVTPDTRVVVLCQDGDASWLAAASLRRIGLRRATDVVRGLPAWREAGLPLAGAAR